MDTDDLMMAIRWAFREDHFVPTEHAHIEMFQDNVSLTDLKRAAVESELIEDYPDRPDGHRMLLLGYRGPDRPVHIVVDLADYEKDWSEPITVVTVYVPEPPEWVDERTRARPGE